MFDIVSWLFPKLPFPDCYTLETSSTSIRNIRCVLQYRGCAYHGWQIQPKGHTVQGIVENCLSRILQESIRIKAASRTDAGVHALMQVINFRTTSKLSTGKLLKGLNSLLPKDISAIYMDEVTNEFDAQFFAKKKTYIYLILNTQQRSPFLVRYTWQIFSTLDIESMQKGSKSLIGKHDFSSFMGAGSDVKNKVREVFRLEVKKISPLIVIEIEADGFLKHMVRNIVGLLVEVGLGKRKWDEVRKILDARNRCMAGINAPANGLFLKEIKY
ncbi:MAG TPA: tRNA pseudouridine(38-40) synthase TruA [Candidatus Desulfofervidus auxilii]|uniref:tRNA pseudouridine synthase A n=1 Tax=Desulfofervidus auxilii TaxID=1621989 RepID=A0A7V0NEK5_DESA2|nr:tRNA pseudouridine(38-40) synthase TruA [Candidatus Desulfofervidus auxilii]